MKILFCSINPLNLQLGASKVIMELAAAMKKLGCECKLASDSEISPASQHCFPFKKLKVYSRDLALYLQKNAQKYDVVDYDHVYLPYPRRDFTSKTLFVARSVLLVQHFERIKIPIFKGPLPFLSWMIRGPWRNFVLKKSIHMCHKTLQEADLINVANVDDKVELERRGFKSEKIIVIPYGLTAERRKEFLEVTPEPPSSPRIAFVGTFDLRKGGGEFPEIVSNVVERFPQARFRLLGARYRTKEQVLRYFPRRLRPYLEVITEYQPHELPNYLKDCSLGIFPSYIEGFGFGVLEMLAASLPVIGYDAPGTTMILPPHFLVSRGDAVAMSRKIIDLLIDKAKLVAARSWAKQRSFDFSWEVSAQQTLEGYTRHLEELRRASR